MTKRLMLLVAALFCMNVHAATVAAPSSTGTWNVTGDVQGVPVILSCALVEADHKLTGSCVDAENKTHAVTGDVKEMTLTWAFDTEYEGTPITVSLAGTMDATGAKMAGTMFVTPMSVDGTFSAIKQVAAPAAAGM